MVQMRTAEDILLWHNCTLHKHKCITLIAGSLPLTHPLPSPIRYTTFQKVNPHPRRKKVQYQNVATIPSEGLLVVKWDEPLVSTYQCIPVIIPRQVLDGVLTAIHLQLSHPTSNQLKKVISSYFYVLDLNKAIYRVTDGGHTCATIKQAPHTIKEQSKSDLLPIVGVSFAADILKHNR